MSPSSAIDKLIAAGWTETRIAKEVGVVQSTINRIRKETQDPSYRTAAALVELAKRKGK